MMVLGFLVGVSVGVFLGFMVGYDSGQAQILEAASERGLCELTKDGYPIWNER